MREWESWSRIIGSRTALPGVFLDAFPYEAPFPYTVYAPAQGWRAESENSKLICLLPDRVVVFEDGKLGPAVRTDYPFYSLQRIVRGRIFLHSWIQLHGLLSGGRMSSTIIYNSVSDYMYDPIVLALRKFAIISDASANSEASAEWKIAFLRNDNLKLYRFGRSAILPGESVKEIIYQPELNAHFWHIFRRRLIPNRIVILTDKEVICVSDAAWDESAASAHLNYGVVKSFVPLRSILGANIVESDRPGLIELLIAQPGGEVRLSFGSRLAAEVEALRSELRDAVGRA